MATVIYENIPDVLIDWAWVGGSCASNQIRAWRNMDHTPLIDPIQSMGNGLYIALLDDVRTKKIR